MYITIRNGVEVRLTPTTPSGPKDHNIQRMLNMPNTVHILPTIVTCPLQNIWNTTCQRS
ncbi:uncharacterized protein RSE6_03449 [Rhynchosporium secalis]|uniref:Uncharacterized protein n=1 Tax=Rhynchosporium secalis TaxID=38038 RepID=A0A1E1M2T4_RHYSE|nr:uncharacterized protein RSE6_03449 [Rhynchosporium secalis]